MLGSTAASTRSVSRSAGDFEGERFHDAGSLSVRGRAARSFVVRTPNSGDRRARVLLAEVGQSVSGRGSLPRIDPPDG